MELKVKITDPIGLHARPASFVVRAANKYESEILLTYLGKTVNLKSIMSVMSLGVKTDAEVLIEATGSDAKQALEEIKKVMSENSLI